MTGSAVTLMTISRCEPFEPPPGLVAPAVIAYRDLPCLQVEAPAWHAVEAAIRRMDDRCFPIVTLSCVRPGSIVDAFEDESAFNVIGGDGRWALFELMGTFWRFEDPQGSSEEVRLWQSDQGYVCQKRHAVTDLRAVLVMARAYWQTGCYDGLTEIGLRTRR